MLKFLKYFLITIGITFVILIVIPLIALICLFGEPYATSEDIKKEFYNNYELISKVSKYIEYSEYNNIVIRNTDYVYEDGEYGTWYVSEVGKIQIEDEEFVNDISILFKEKEYLHIEKNGNIVYLQLWANKDAGRGVVYSIDGSEPIIQFLTKLEKLDKNNWYYYEADFNEWKRRQSDAY